MAKGPMVVPWGRALSYERGNPVGVASRDEPWIGGNGSQAGTNSDPHQKGSPCSEYRGEDLNRKGLVVAGSADEASWSNHVDASGPD